MIKIIFFMLIFVVMLIYFLSMKLIYLLISKFQTNLEIECGMFSFLNKNSSSIYYIMFLIIFLIFDLEIILFFYLILKMMNKFIMLFLFIILLSLILELFECSLKWND